MRACAAATVAVTGWRWLRSSRESYVNPDSCKSGFFLGSRRRSPANAVEPRIAAPSPSLATRNVGECEPQAKRRARVNATVLRFVEREWRGAAACLAAAGAGDAGSPVRAGRAVLRTDLHARRTVIVAQPHVVLQARAVRRNVQLPGALARRRVEARRAAGLRAHRHVDGAIAIAGATDSSAGLRGGGRRQGRAAHREREKERNAAG